MAITRQELNPELRYLIDDTIEETLSDICLTDRHTDDHIGIYDIDQIDGQLLINHISSDFLNKWEYRNNSVGQNITDQIIEKTKNSIKLKNVNGNRVLLYTSLMHFLEEDKTYSLIYDVDKSASYNYWGLFIRYGAGTIFSKDTQLPNIKNASYKRICYTFTAESCVTDADKIMLAFHEDYETNGELELKNMMLLEGDWSNKQLPEYFEGMKVIGVDEYSPDGITSKNIFNNKYLEGKYTVINKKVELIENKDYLSFRLRVKPSSRYNLTLQNHNINKWYDYISNDNKGVQLIYENHNNECTLIDSNRILSNVRNGYITTNNDTIYVYFSIRKEVDVSSVNICIKREIEDFENNQFINYTEKPIIKITEKTDNLFKFNNVVTFKNLATNSLYGRPIITKEGLIRIVSRSYNFYSYGIEVLTTSPNTPIYIKISYTGDKILRLFLDDDKVNGVLDRSIISDELFSINVEKPGKYLLVLVCTGKYDTHEFKDMPVINNIYMGFTQPTKNYQSYIPQQVNIKLQKPLASLPNGVKDILYNKEGYVKQSTESLILTGNETILAHDGSGNNNTNSTTIVRIDDYAFKPHDRQNVDYIKIDGVRIWSKDSNNMDYGRMIPGYYIGRSSCRLNIRFLNSDVGIESSDNITVRLDKIKKWLKLNTPMVVFDRSLSNKPYDYEKYEIEWGDVLWLK